MMRKKILIIDDDKDFLMLVKNLLQINGFDVYTDSGLNVLPGVIKIHPNLIIVDKNLPDKASHIICDELRAVVNIPIVIWSAHIDKAELFENCADAFLQKPTNMQDLLKVVNDNIPGGISTHTETQ